MKFSQSLWIISQVLVIFFTIFVNFFTYYMSSCSYVFLSFFSFFDLWFFSQGLWGISQRLWEISQNIARILNFFEFVSAYSLVFVFFVKIFTKIVNFSQNAEENSSDLNLCVRLILQALTKRTNTKQENAYISEKFSISKLFCEFLHNESSYKWKQLQL